MSYTTKDEILENIRFYGMCYRGYVIDYKRSKDKRDLYLAHTHLKMAKQYALYALLYHREYEAILTYY